MELRAVRKTLRSGELRGVVNARNVEVEAKNAAAYGGGDLQCVAAGAAADFEDMGLGSES